MNGGYLMIHKNDSDIYAKAQKALVLGKPILFYENNTTCYYIDTISGGEITTEIVDDVEVTTYGDIILTKGGKTITITSANAVSEIGSIQNHLYLLTIKDSDAYVQFFTTEKIEDHTIEDASDFSNADVNYLKSLKNKFKSNASMFGYDSGGAVLNRQSYGCCNGEYLFLVLNNYEYEIDLDNPTSQNDSETLEFTCEQLF